MSKKQATTAILFILFMCMCLFMLSKVTNINIKSGEAQEINKENVDSSSDISKDTYNKVEELLGVNPFLITPIRKTELIIAYTQHGAFILDKNYNYIISGSIHSLVDGHDVLSDNLRSHKDELNKKIMLSKLLKSDNLLSSENIGQKQEIKSKQSIEADDLNKIQRDSQTGSINSNQVTRYSQDKRLENVEMQTPAISLNQSGIGQNYLSNNIRVQPNLQNHIESTNPRFADTEVQQAASGEPKEPTTKAERVKILNNMLLRMSPQDRLNNGPLVSVSVLPDIPDDFLVVYPNNPSVPYKGTLTVAVDYTCHFCKALHSIIPNLTNEGVKVRYMPYSRARIFDLPVIKPEDSIDKLIAADKTGQLNLLGQNNARIMCSADRPQAVDQLFALGEIVHAPVITKQCEDMARQFEVLGDMYFSSRTPYIIWGDHNTHLDERGVIEGIIPGHDTSLSDLLQRIERQPTNRS